MKESSRNMIGILDGGIEGYQLFEKIVDKFPNQSFVYINDLLHYPYGDDNDENAFYINSMVNQLLNYGCNLIICVNAYLSIKFRDVFLEMKDLKIIHLSDLIIDFVNRNYSKKELVLLGKSTVLKENYFQKRLNYNHLYNLASDELENIIINKQTKTSLSFNKTKETFKIINGRTIDLLIYFDSYLDELYLEFKEYIKQIPKINLLQVIYDELVAHDILFMVDKKQKVIIASSVTKKEFNNVICKKNKYNFITYVTNFVKEVKDDKE